MAKNDDVFAPMHEHTRLTRFDRRRGWEKKVEKTHLDLTRVHLDVTSKGDGCPWLILYFNEHVNITEYVVVNARQQFLVN